MTVDGRAGGPGTRRRRAPRLAWLHVLRRVAGLAEWHHGPDRIDRPRVAGRDAPWAEVLDDLGDAARVRRRRRRAGRSRALPRHRARLRLRAGRSPRAPSCVRSAARPSSRPRPSTTRRCWWPRTSWRATRCSTRCGTRLRPGCCSSSGRTRSSPTATAPRSPTRYGTCATTGRPAARSGSSTRGARETATLADEHLAVRPGSDVAVLAAVVAALLVDGPRADEPCRADDLDTLRARVRAVDAGPCRGRGRDRRHRRHPSDRRGARAPGPGRGDVRDRHDDGDRRDPRRVAALAGA